MAPDEGEVIVDETPEEYAWMLQARCRGASPTEFFPSDGLGVESAQHICEGCPVRTECLEYALVNRIEHGVWGGVRARAPAHPAPPPRADREPAELTPDPSWQACSNSSTSSGAET